MFLPYSDDAPKKAFAPVTHGLIVLQALATLLAVSHERGEALVRQLLVGPSPAFLERWAFDPHAPSVATFVAALFLHVGLASFVAHAVVLHVVGRPLERRLGQTLFLGLYVAAAAIGAVVQGLVFVGPTVGPWGATCGLMGAYVLLLPDTLVSVVCALGPCLAYLVVSAGASGSRGLGGMPGQVGTIGVLALFQAWNLRRQEVRWGETLFGLVGVARLEVSPILIVALGALLQALAAWVQIGLGGSTAIAYGAQVGGLATGLLFGTVALVVGGLVRWVSRLRRAPARVSTPPTKKRRTLKRELARELVSVLEKGGAASAVHLYAQAAELRERPVLAPALQDRLARLLLVRNKTLGLRALEDLLTTHRTSVEGQRAYVALVERARPATSRTRRAARERRLSRSESCAV